MSDFSERSSAPQLGGDLAAAYFKYVLEWLIWLILAVFTYSQTSLFDKKIAEYAFGATGWPRMICLAVILGATGQLAAQILSARRTGVIRDSQKLPVNSEKAKLWSLFQKSGIFLTPLAYLYFMTGLGFYVATPIFIVAMLILLEVRSVKAMLTVTVIVYFLSLLIFTRFFYVALPIGSSDFFYPINNWIVSMIRVGL